MRRATRGSSTSSIGFLHRGPDSYNSAAPMVEAKSVVISVGFSGYVADATTRGPKLLIIKTMAPVTVSAAKRQKAANRTEGKIWN